MNDPYRQGPPQRAWRQDQGAIVAGVCAGIAEDLDLPLPLIRMVAVLFAVLPTGLAYLALSLLLRRRPSYRGVGPRRGTRDGAGRMPRDTGRSQPASPALASQSWELLRHRFAMLEPRLKNIEAFVTSSDFELHRGFRRMGQ